MSFLRALFPSRTTGAATSSELPPPAVASGNNKMENNQGRKTLSMNHAPTPREWLRATWVDLATMLIMGIIGLVVYTVRPAPSRSFPVLFNDGEIVYPQFAYPLRNEIIPIWAAALLVSLVPIVVFLVVSIRVRSFWDLNNAVFGLFYSLITAAVFQVVLKWLIGGLRPHFLVVYKPSLATMIESQTGNGFRNIMYDRSICTGDEKEINDAMESFPSGHSTAAFAAFVFLALYLNAKLKVWSNYHPAMWKLIAVYAPILGATLIAGALTIDEYHNWYDCVAGAIIGTVFAFSSYRMVYCSIWDWKVNHVPANRALAFTFSSNNPGIPYRQAVVTRTAGWGRIPEFGNVFLDSRQNIADGQSVMMRTRESRRRISERGPDAVLDQSCPTSRIPDRPRSRQPERSRPTSVVEDRVKNSQQDHNRPTSIVNDQDRNSHYNYVPGAHSPTDFWNFPYKKPAAGEHPIDTANTDNIV